MPRASIFNWLASSRRLQQRKFRGIQYSRKRHFFHRKCGNDWGTTICKHSCDYFDFKIISHYYWKCVRRSQSSCRDYFKSGFCAGRFHDFSPRSSVCLGRSEVAGRQDSSQLAPSRPLAPQKQEMVIVLRCFSSPYLYPHFSLSLNEQKGEKKQRCNNIYVWKNGPRP